MVETEQVAEFMDHGGKEIRRLDDMPIDHYYRSGDRPRCVVDERRGKAQDVRSVRTGFALGDAPIGIVDNVVSSVLRVEIMALIIGRKASAFQGKGEGTGRNILPRLERMPYEGGFFPAGDQ